MSVERRQAGSDHLRGELATELATDSEAFARRGQRGPAQVPRHLPAGRPRRASGAGVAEAAARLLLHGPYRRARRRADGRAVARPRSPRRAGRRDDAADHPPGRAVPLRPQGVAAPARQRHQRRRDDDVGGVRRRRAQHHGLPVAGRPPSRAPPARRRARSRRFRPRTAAYWELWVDGDKAATAEPRCAVGARRRRRSRCTATVYLPRKFKIAVAWPGDNCVDVLANDIGIVPTLSDGLTGDVTGYDVFVGGGLGQSHARPDDTYPRLASPLGWIRPERVRRRRRGDRHRPARLRQP